MQTSNFRRVLAGVLLTCLLLGCAGSTDDQYASLKDVPLAPARLHAVTVVTDDATLSQLLAKKGYTAMTFTSNYPASDRVEASLWSVPEPVVARAAHLKGPAADSPDLRVLVMELAAKGREAEAATNRAFFRNVLGSEVPVLPQGIEATESVRVKVWTYLIPDVVEANKRLRANNIPVVFDPVSITTAYLGEHKTMAIRAPDGTIVELVETMAR
jgi:hypothetical protein